MAPKQRRVLLVGTGRLGSSIASAILGRGDLDLRVMARATTAEEKVNAMKAMGAEVVVGDTSDPASLTSACRGAFAVVSAIHGFSNPEEQLLRPQRALMRAARDAGVTQFLPSDYGTVAREGVPPGIPVCEVKKQVGEEAAALADESPGFHYTLLRAGGFVELFFTPALGLDLGAKKCAVWGSGEEVVAFTAISDLAKFIAAAIGRESVYNRAVDVGSFKTTWRQVLGLVRARYGVEVATACQTEAELRPLYESLDESDLHQRSAVGMKLAMASGCGALLDFDGGASLFPDVAPLALDDVVASLESLAGVDAAGGAVAIAK